jgi:hypothetical protein
VNLEKFNESLRIMFSDLISDGYNQNDISAVTFGVNRQDQMKEFLRGRRISGKPLIGMFTDLGFEVHIVPVNVSDSAAVEKINEITSNALEAIQLTFVNYLENKNHEKKHRKNMILFIDYMLEKINKRKVKK